MTLLSGHLPTQWNEGSPEDGDDLYDKAVKIVLRDKRCSTSYIQRRLGIGRIDPRQKLALADLAALYELF